MPEPALDQIIENLRSRGAAYFPGRGEVSAVRVVGHTPKPEHYTYEIVLDFANGSERVSAKLYLDGKNSRHVQEAARAESQNLTLAHQVAERAGLGGIPRPLGDFIELGAVVSTKTNGLPLQSIIMKAALLPEFDNHGLLEVAASKAGEWLRLFHRATVAAPALIDQRRLLSDLEKLCARAKKDGLPEESTQAILGKARRTLSKHQKPVPSSAVLNDFVPLNVLVAEEGVGFCDFANLKPAGISLWDVARFVAAVEALEKYPFCNRSLTSTVQDAFVEAYRVGPQEQELLSVMKMKVLLQMFAQGRAIKESAVRKQVMWANVMKRFIQQAAERSMAPAA